ncbi:hypothetical protein IW261DRAFT_1568572 [Armillaria novae-zelandiae]|uniref:Uncharacterized protein n=1 Tax=Armillaria novae-zelandiae TaxID=153914 RepID=A0AA39NZK4_9AGAR|nr:hypothetical protein IW261DRAFT_1568572 [Armillaria novae-zelandiae]
MFSTTLKVLKFLFYSAMASLAPHVDTEPPKNTIIFDPDPHVRNLRRTVNACAYLRDLARYCPHGAGEAVIKKVEFMKSSRVPNHEFLLCHVKDPRNIPGRDTVIQIERFNDSAPSQRPDTDIPSLQPPAKDRRSLSPQSISDASSHSSSPSIFGPALDLFTIFCMPIITSKDYDVLSTLNFNDDSTFVAEQAAAMAMVASDAADEYNPISHQCYWYARVIFNIIVETQAGNYIKTPPEDNKRMGRRGMVRIVNDAASNIFIPPADTSERLIRTYLTTWHQWQVDIEKKKKEKDAPLQREEAARRDAEAATEREEEARRDAEAAAEREEAAQRDAEAATEREEAAQRDAEAATEREEEARCAAEAATEREEAT